jgi:hypothetical protein
MTETIAAILDPAGKLTVVGILALDLVVLAVGLQRQWYVPGWLYRKEVEDKIAWRDIVRRNAGVADRSLDVAATIVPAVVGREGV